MQLFLLNVGGIFPWLWWWNCSLRGPKPTFSRRLCTTAHPLYTRSTKIRRRGRTPRCASPGGPRSVRRRRTAARCWRSPCGWCSAAGSSASGGAAGCWRGWRGRRPWPRRSGGCGERDDGIFSATMQPQHGVLKIRRGVQSPGWCCGRGRSGRARQRTGPGLASRSGPARGGAAPLAFFTANRFCVARLWWRAGCLTAQSGGFRPG